MLIVDDGFTNPSHCNLVTELDRTKLGLLPGPEQLDSYVIE